MKTGTFFCIQLQYTPYYNLLSNCTSDYLEVIDDILAKLTSAFLFSSTRAVLLKVLHPKTRPAYGSSRTTVPCGCPTLLSPPETILSSSWDPQSLINVA